MCSPLRHDSEVAMEDVVTSSVRTVTAEEVEHFHRRGWVKLERLVDPEEAARLLEKAQEILAVGATARQLEVGGSTDPTIREPVDNGWWRDYHGLARDDPQFAAVAWSPVMARNIAALLATESAIRFNIDLLSCKVAGSDPASNGQTPFHQDFPGFPFDRPHHCAVWIALGDVTPAQGSMRFLEGSHRDGLVEDINGVNLLERHPELTERYELSPPLTYRPGDATVHHGLMVHGAPNNATPAHRWSYIAAYFADDVRYTGRPSPRFDGIGLAVGGKIDHPRFPVLPASP